MKPRGSGAASRFGGTEVEMLDRDAEMVRFRTIVPHRYVVRRAAARGTSVHDRTTVKIPVIEDSEQSADAVRATR